MRFINDYSLNLYVNHYATGSPLSQYVVTAAGQQSDRYQYLGVGDSFASGEGAYQYKAATDTSQNKCHLSERSYPYLIASDLGYAQYESVACSGARLDDFVDVDNNYGGQVQDNKKRKDRDINGVITSMLPGYLAQKEFVNHYQPGVITVSGVGNDIGFSDKIKRCLDTDTCYSSYEDRLEIANEVHDQFYKLTDTYEQLKTAGSPTMRVYAIGYPQIGDADGNCALNVHLSHDELMVAQLLISYLNGMIKTAAAKTGVYYVDTEQAFAGHRLCETDSWDIAVNGLTLGDDIPDISLIHGPIGNESYHPNALGQLLLETAILSQTNNLGAAMPVASPATTFPDVSDSLPLLDAPKASRTMRQIRHITGIEGGVIQTGKNIIIRVDNLAPVLKIGSTVKAWLHSEPLYLGDYTVNDDGGANLQFMVPDSVSAGFHTLHLYGTNTSGEAVDFYETVYVNNGNDGPCGITTVSGQDTDKDGIDDACDPAIDQALPSPPDSTPDPTPDPPQPTDPETDPTPPQDSPQDPAPPTQPDPPSTPIPPTTPLPPPKISLIQQLIQAVVTVLTMTLKRKLL
jgi:hypothetical protein